MRNARTALVTGANKGIGFEVARELARLGLRVFLGARNEKAGRAAADKLSESGSISFLQIDVSDAGSIQRAAEELARQTDRLDVLINNAGILLDNDKDAFTLVSGHEVQALQAIEHFIGRKISRLKLENFPYLYTALFEPESAASKRSISGRRTHRGYSFGRRR